MSIVVYDITTDCLIVVVPAMGTYMELGCAPRGGRLLKRVDVTVALSVYSSDHVERDIDIG